MYLKLNKKRKRKIKFTRANIKTKVKNTKKMLQVSVQNTDIAGEGPST